MELFEKLWALSSALVECKTPVVLSEGNRRVKEEELKLEFTFFQNVRKED